MKDNQSAPKSLGLVPASDAQVLAIPAEVERAPVMRRQKVTRRSANKFKEDVLLAWTPTLMRKLMEQLHRGLCAEDERAIGRVMELLGLVQAKGGGVSIVNTLVQGQVNNSGYGHSFDSVVRKLAQQSDVVENGP